MKQIRPDQNSSLFSTERVLSKAVGSIAGYVVKKCRHFYYRTNESFGHHKRDIVVCRVEDACDSLLDTREHFEDALDRFKSIVLVPDDTLVSRYRQIQRQYDISLRKSDAVSEKIQLIEEISDALFNEWEQELELYVNRTLRSQSRTQLRVTRQHYGRLIKALHRAEAKIKPVLSAFRDQVLFMKHNLNAQAIAALQHELVDMTVDIAQLIKAMESSIKEANSFVSSLVEHKALPDPGQN